MERGRATARLERHERIFRGGKSHEIPTPVSKGRTTNACWEHRDATDFKKN